MLRILKPDWAVFMKSAPDLGRSVHLRYPPIDGFWTWDIKRNRVYGDANLSDYFGLTLDEFSHGASLERCMQSIEVEDRLRVHTAIRKAVEKRDRASGRSIRFARKRWGLAKSWRLASAMSTILARRLSTPSGSST